MTLKALACAKINLGLDVLGKRADGFHEIRTVMASISLVDRVFASAHPSFAIHMDRPGVPDGDNLVTRAANALQDPPGVSLSVQKRIPAAAGLGGASADAVAALRLTDAVLGLHTPSEDLRTISGRLGSDVPFFLDGGIALSEGRGDILTSLPFRAMHVVLVVPPIVIERKTATLYSLLTSADYGDGHRVNDVVDALSSGTSLTGQILDNTFLRPLAAIVPDLFDIPAQMQRAGASSANLSGAGPAFYSLEPDAERAHDVGSALRNRFGREASVFVCRTTRHAIMLDTAASPASIGLRERDAPI